MHVLIFHSCYFLPMLFKKHGGEIKDSEIEFPEVGKEHYNLAFDKLLDHWLDMVFGARSHITRDGFKLNVKNNYCKSSCDIKDDPTGCGIECSVIF